MGRIRIAILLVLFVGLSLYTFVSLYSLLRAEYEIVSYPSYIRDGDTFEIPNYPAIRLADINCPERDEAGGSTATQTLTELIWGEQVYIDVDDVYRTGPYGRLICVVYVDWNATHLLNVNLAMVELGQAYYSDYDNEWNPYAWSLYVEKLSDETLYQLLGYSAIFSLIVVLVGNYLFSVVLRRLRSGYQSSRDYMKRQLE